MGRKTRNDPRVPRSQDMWDLIIQGADEVIQGSLQDSPGLPRFQIPIFLQSRLVPTNPLSVRSLDLHSNFPMEPWCTGEPCIYFDMMPRMLLYPILNPTCLPFSPGNLSIEDLFFQLVYQMRLVPESRHTCRSIIPFILSTNKICGGCFSLRSAEAQAEDWYVPSESHSEFRSRNRYGGVARHRRLI